MPVPELAARRMLGLGRRDLEHGREPSHDGDGHVHLPDPMTGNIDCYAQFGARGTPGSALVM